MILKPKNKRAELGPIAIVVLIVVIGLVVFFGIKYISKNNNDVQNFTVLSNVTPLNDSVISTASQVVLSNGNAVNLFDGKNLTVQSVSSVPNGSNMTLIRIIYPNKTITPGDIMSSNITQICAENYSEDARDVDQSLKDQIYRTYKLSPIQPEGDFQIDHLVPLGLGGSNDARNLWPQPLKPRPGYKEKDVLERYYHEQVCNGKMDLREAQAVMANNWFSGYVKYIESKSK